MRTGADIGSTFSDAAEKHISDTTSDPSNVAKRILSGGDVHVCWSGISTTPPSASSTDSRTPDTPRATLRRAAALCDEDSQTLLRAFLKPLQRYLDANEAARTCTIAPEQSLGPKCSPIRTEICTSEVTFNDLCDWRVLTQCNPLLELGHNAACYADALGGEGNESPFPTSEQPWAIPLDKPLRFVQGARKPTPVPPGASPGRSLEDAAEKSANPDYFLLYGNGESQGVCDTAAV